MKTSNQRQTNERQETARVVFALVFGFFLGLALLKFGNPIILNSKIPPPNSFSEAVSLAWPPGWSVWFLAPLAFAGFFIAFTKRVRWTGSKWLWLLPLFWLGWQFVSATGTIDASLTRLTIPHLAGCVACWFLGAWLLREPRALRVAFIGVFAALAFCLVRAVDQKLFEFPAERQALVEGQQTGWTNFAPEMILQLKADRMIITTNGADIVNPIMMSKYEKGRVFGTLVYPNALAGAVLLLLPAALALVLTGTKQFRSTTRIAAVALTLFLGVGSLYWTGSKSGWLIAMALLGVWLFRLNWSAKLKWTVLALLLVAGTSAFAIRFHHYFSAGATSVGARFDYWRAAIQNTSEHPLLGSGPGTFFRAYERLKSPESEMARLTHNDYLQQFSDSGIPAGLCYAAWIGLLLVTVGRGVWRQSETLPFAIFLGLLGWFAQGLSEFGLYIPALAWTAFAIAGSLLNSAQVNRTENVSIHSARR